MAEPKKNKKPSLHQILNQISEDEEFSTEDRERAQEVVRELEYKDWCARQLKAGRK